MKKQTLKLTAFLSMLLVFSFFGLTVFATEISWPASPMGTVLLNYEDTTLTALTQYFYEWGISIGGLFAFVSIVVAGFQYLTSTGNPFKTEQAKERIRASLLGLALLLGTFLILNTINPELTNISIDLDSIGTTSLAGTKFVEYEIQSDCAYAKLYENAEQAISAQAYEPNDITGKMILVGKGLKKDSETVYNAVKFFSKIVLRERITTFDENGTINQGIFKEIGYKDYPPVYKELIVGKMNDDYYAQSLGSECLLYFFTTENYSSFPSDTTPSVAYPTNNLLNNSTSDPNETESYFLKANK